MEQLVPVTDEAFHAGLCHVGRLLAAHEHVPMAESSKSMEEGGWGGGKAVWGKGSGRWSMVMDDYMIVVVLFFFSLILILYK